MFVSLVRVTLVLGLLSAGHVGFAGTSGSTPSRVDVVQLCVSAPIGTPSLQLLARGMFDAVGLATQDWRYSLLRVHVDNSLPLEMDDSPVTLENEREAANAARCLADSHAIAYIGPLNSQAAAASEPVLNRGGMAQISPSTTQPLLTSPKTRGALEPRTFDGTLKTVTFYRVIANDRVQGASMAAYLARTRKARTLVALDDGSVYGTGLVAASRACATKLGLRIVGQVHLSVGSPYDLLASTRAVADLIVALRSNAVLYGGGPEPITELTKQLQRVGYHGPVLGGDALRADLTIPPRVAGYHTVNVLASNIGPDPDAGMKRFNDRFRRRFGYWPPMYAALAYDAASTVYEGVLALHRHSGPNRGIQANRSALLRYIRLADRKGITGVIRFDRNGDTVTRAVSVYAAHDGRWSYTGSAPDCGATHYRG